MRNRTKRKIVVEIDNLTEAQEIALNDLFATWENLGGMGSSRWTAFFADGDGDFRPEITINGEAAKFTDLIDRKKLWEGDHGNYKIDFDMIGWALQAIEDRETTCSVENPDRTKKYHDFPRERSRESVCKNCGLPWEESYSYSPPIDYKVTPHFYASQDGATVATPCPQCGYLFNHQIHMHGESGPPEQEQLHGS